LRKERTTKKDPIDIYDSSIAFHSLVDSIRQPSLCQTVHTYFTCMKCFHASLTRKIFVRCVFETKWCTLHWHMLNNDDERKENITLKGNKKKRFRNEGNPHMQICNISKKLFNSSYLMWKIIWWWRCYYFISLYFFKLSGNQNNICQQSYFWSKISMFFSIFIWKYDSKVKRH
jgi:hypothetical protein